MSATPGMDLQDAAFSRELLRFKARGRMSWFYCTAFMDALVATARRFPYEGVAAFVAARPSPGLVPLWRMRGRSTGRYFLTARDDERDLLRRSGGFTRGTVIAYVSLEPRTGLIPMYRLGREGSETHLWTAGEGERAHALAAHGLDVEDVAFFVRPA